jgi:uncharacterized repeat protein (TIGR03803 family)
LVRDAAGNLYGPTYEGGSMGNGAIFALRPQPGGQWQYEVLYSFQGGNDGQGPGAVVLHSDALYGTTVEGGGSKLCTSGCGTVFKLAASKTGGSPVETVLHRFSAFAQGTFPDGPIAFGQGGSAFGAAGDGGSGCGAGCGVVFEMTPGGNGMWQYQVAHAFNGQDGTIPQYVSTHRGNVYGTTNGGGAPFYGGVVFEISVPIEATECCGPSPE